MYKKISNSFNKFLDLFTVKKRGKRYLRIIITMNQLKIIAAIFVIACLSALIKLSSFDINLDCDRATDFCVISKTSSINPTSVPISRFKISRILDISVEQRKIDNDKIIYDILLDNGPYYEQMYIDYAFNTVIKANTVKMKFSKYLRSLSTQKFSDTKRCYFDSYFCF